MISKEPWQQKRSAHLAEPALIIILFRVAFAAFSADVKNWQSYLERILAVDYKSGVYVAFIVLLFSQKARRIL